MKTVFFLILLFFALFGFSEFLHILKLFLIFPKKKTNTKLIIYLHNQTAEQQLAYVGEQYFWHGNKFADIVIPVCEALDEETFERCKLIAGKYNIKFPQKFDERIEVCR